MSAQPIVGTVVVPRDCGSINLWAQCVAEALASRDNATDLMAMFMNMGTTGCIWEVIGALPDTEGKRELLANVHVYSASQSTYINTLCVKHQYEYTERQAIAPIFETKEPIDPLPALLHIAALRPKYAWYIPCLTDNIMRSFVRDYFLPTLLSTFGAEALLQRYAPKELERYNKHTNKTPSVMKNIIRSIEYNILPDSTTTIATLHEKLSLTQTDLAIWFRRYYVDLLAGPLTFTIPGLRAGVKWTNKTDANRNLNALWKALTCTNAGPHRLRVTQVSETVSKSLATAAVHVTPGHEWFRVTMYTSPTRIPTLSGIYQQALPRAVTTSAAFAHLRTWLAGRGIDPLARIGVIITGLMPIHCANRDLCMIIASYV